jgi:hypothetical protein
MAFSALVEAPSRSNSPPLIAPPSSNPYAPRRRGVRVSPGARAMRVRLGPHPCARMVVCSGRRRECWAGVVVGGAACPRLRWPNSLGPIRAGRAGVSAPGGGWQGRQGRGDGWAQRWSPPWQFGAMRVIGHRLIDAPLPPSIVLNCAAQLPLGARVLAAGEARCDCSSVHINY